MKQTNKEHHPLVSIAMPVYNGERFITEAIASILNQTYKNIELLIIDDGSTDNSMALVGSFSDDRIRIFKNDKNCGVSYTRNRALDLAKGEYLAWMDCDDISLPNKIELQVAFMEQHADIGVCGTSYLRFYGNEVFYQDVQKQNHEEIRVNFVFKPATIFMPTAFIRMNIVQEHHLRFDESLAMAEDYDYFQRFCQISKASNLTEVLFHYRDTPNSLTYIFEHKKHDRFLLKQKIYARILNGMSINTTEQDLINHENCTNSEMFTDFKTFRLCAEHLRSIEKANRKSKQYDQKMMKKVVKEQFFFIGKKAGGLGLKALFFYLKKSIQWNFFNGLPSLAKVAVRSILRYKEYNLKNRVFKKTVN